MGPRVGAGPHCARRRRGRPAGADDRPALARQPRSRHGEVTLRRGPCWRAARHRVLQVAERRRPAPARPLGHLATLARTPSSEPAAVHDDAPSDRHRRCAGQRRGRLLEVRALVLCRWRRPSRAMIVSSAAVVTMMSRMGRFASHMSAGIAASLPRRNSAPVLRGPGPVRVTMTPAAVAGHPSDGWRGAPALIVELPTASVHRARTRQAPSRTASGPRGSWIVGMGAGGPVMEPGLGDQDAGRPVLAHKLLGPDSNRARRVAIRRCCSRGWPMTRCASSNHVVGEIGVRNAAPTRSWSRVRVVGRSPGGPVGVRRRRSAAEPSDAQPGAERLHQVTGW